MVRVRPERFPQGIAKKLQARSTGPFKILKRFGPNAYVLDLPSDMGINSTFNVEGLQHLLPTRLLMPLQLMHPNTLIHPFPKANSHNLPHLPLLKKLWKSYWMTNWSLLGK